MKTRNKKLLLFVPAIIALTLSEEAYAQANPADIPYLATNTVQSDTVSKTGEYIAVPFADITGWRYKAINGEMYRRQYNYSKQEWIGEWELC
ncbi:MAG: hypothetical protein PWP24_1319 [Clostridiales bacterium]|nr:hypothetical protein [Clostridiales bacterium]